MRHGRARGPFVAIFYASTRHWDPGQLGILIAYQSLAGVAVQTFTGNWVDESNRKRAITVAAALMVATGAACIPLLAAFGSQIAVQLVIGLA